MAHLLHVIADLEYGGAQTQLLALAEANLERRDRWTVASLRRPGAVRAWLRAAGARVVWLKQRFAADPLAAGRLRWLMRQTRPDAVQTWDLSSGAYVRAVGPKSRWVHTVREPPDSTAWRARRERAVLRSCDAVIVPDEHILHNLLENGLDASRVAVLPNTYLASSRHRDRNAARRALRTDLGLSVDGGPTDSGPVIGAVARWDTMRRGKEVLWAADLVHVLYPEATLLFVGAGRMQAHCARFAREVAEAGVNRCVGSRDDWLAMLAGLDVVWCPSGALSAPTPLVEAMAAGVPVVAAEEPGREALIEDGATGWLTRWDHRAGWTRATQRVCSDPERSEQVAEAARERVAERHAPDRVAAQHRRLVLGEADADSEAPGSGAGQALVSP